MLSKNLFLEGGKLFAKLFLSALVLFFCLLCPKVVLASEEIGALTDIAQTQDQNTISDEQNEPEESFESQNTEDKKQNEDQTFSNNESSPIGNPEDNEVPNQDSQSDEEPIDNDKTNEDKSTEELLINDNHFENLSPDNPERQTTDYSCGPAALVTWIKLLEGQTTEQEIMELAQTNEEEVTTFLNLKNAAIAKGFTGATVYKFTIDDLAKIKLPALIYLYVEDSKIGHYAVLISIENDIFTIIDPSLGKVTKTRKEFSMEFGEYTMINGEIEEEIENTAKTQNSVLDQTPENSQTENTVTEQPALESQPLSQDNTTLETQIFQPVSKSANLIEPRPILTKASNEELAKIKGKGYFMLFNAIRTAISSRFALIVSSHFFQRMQDRCISVITIINIITTGTRYKNTVTGAIIYVKGGINAGNLAVIRNGNTLITTYHIDANKVNYYRSIWKPI